MLDLSRITHDTDDWRLICGTLLDLEDALGAFHSHRFTRKVTVFGSARSDASSPACQLAQELAREATTAGFDVLTGAGAGVMEAANRGAGPERSFGLNVQLPYEQHPNPFVTATDDRLIHFRYFFTRKLFFLRESDALVVLPGGFGTLDELFEALTLIQTGRTPPIPVVLLAPSGDEFWESWRRDLLAGLAGQGLIAPEDGQLLREARTAAGAMAVIRRFYRVFHTSQQREGGLSLLLHAPLGEAELSEIQARFDDLLSSGRFDTGESCDDHDRPRPSLQFDFDQRRVGRLYELIDHLNGLDLPRGPDLEHPEQRSCPDTSLPLAAS